jgi:hypothetical protein
MQRFCSLLAPPAPPAPPAPQGAAVGKAAAATAAAAAVAAAAAASRRRSAGALAAAALLRRLLAGERRIRPADWRKHSLLTNGFHARSPTVEWLWELVEEAPDRRRAQLLRFVTARGAPPAGGFGALLGEGGSGGGGVGGFSAGVSGGLSLRLFEVQRLEADERAEADAPLPGTAACAGSGTERAYEHAHAHQLLPFPADKAAAGAVAGAGTGTETGAGGAGAPPRRRRLLRLPTASTCFNTLRLPEYASKAELAEALWAAVEYNGGCGFDERGE